MSREQLPRHYIEFIARAKRKVVEKGLRWEIPLDEAGHPQTGADWDLRRIAGSKETVASRLNGFAVDTELRAKALEIGWSPAHVARGAVLSQPVQDLIKAAAVQWCLEGRPVRDVRDKVRHLRSIFSVVDSVPWQLSTSDLNRILELNVSNNLRRAISSCAKIYSENLLSVNGPISPEVDSSAQIRLLESLSDRKAKEKLPDETALYELARIVFQERPKGHLDVLRFGVSRLLILTGLRLEEIRWLPLDCLRWSEHVDSVTGKPAGEVGGASRTLRLRYFGVKRKKGRAEVLTEASQQVPERFQSLVAETVAWVASQTEELRKVHRQQEMQPALQPKSWHSKIQIRGGPTVCGSEFLFLQAAGRSDVTSDELLPNIRVGLLTVSSIYAFLGVGTPPTKRTGFDFYRRDDSPSVSRIAPHSCRHLLNGELFRLGVSDTIITKHFGRQSVAQSHEYDHRSLEEQLRDISIPDVAKGIVPPGLATVVAKLVVGGFIARSSIAQSFLHIQREQGDAAAFIYLAANADGFHVTPYGFCINSFAMNPCPRHLKCFDGCKHYAPSGMAEHRVSLEALRDNLKIMRDKAVARPRTSIGYRNQVAHASQLVDGVEAALAAQPGVLLFPSGEDFSSHQKDIYS